MFIFFPKNYDAIKKLSLIIILKFGVLKFPGFSTLLLPIPYLTAYEIQNPLTLDTIDNLALPRRFRSTSLPISHEKINHYLKTYTYFPSLKGYTELKASGSAQFSRKNILTALSFMQGKVYIVDLRQESHGFINGEAVSWYGKHNWANEGQKDSTIKNLEINLFDRLINLKTTEILPSYKQPDKISLNIKTALTEEQLIEKLGLEYIRLSVRDHSEPTNEIIDQFIYFVKELPQNSWLHFHCRGGSGRTTTFLVMYDIIRNGHCVNLKDIIARHALSGVKDLQKIPSSSDDHWRYEGALKRLQVIERFYLYVQDPDGYASRSWMEWLNLKK